MKQSLLLILLAIPFFSIAQDTTVVQTFTHASTTRAGVFQFPDDGKTYAKILMEYNMRCHDNRVGSGNVGCREWDYSCNTYVTDSSRYDSLMRTHPDKIISNFSGDTFAYSNDPVFDYTQRTLQSTGLPSGAMTNSTEVVMANIANSDILDQDRASCQYILNAAELTGAGLTAGEIKGLSLNFEMGDFMSPRFRIRLQHHNSNGVDPLNPVMDGWQEVYFNEINVTQAGDNPMIFHTPFSWDGISNILVDLLYDQKITPTSDPLYGDMNAAPVAMLSNKKDMALWFDGSQYVDMRTHDINKVEDEITIMLWINGHPNSLPANTYIFEGRDKDNGRQINVHLPWSNGRVYWDCGGDGGSYDRIEKQANPQDYEGRWNHWAFTKNVATGSMKMYLNGQLWHSGTGKTSAIKELTNFFIGKGVTVNDAWFGWMNDFILLNKELSESEIQSLMIGNIDDMHPLSDNMLVYLPFEEGMGDQVQNMANALYSEIKGAGYWRELESKEYHHNYSLIPFRPATKLIQGDFDAEVDLTHIIDSLPGRKHNVRFFHTEGTDLIEDTPQSYWPAGNRYVVDESGNIVDSVFVQKDGELSISELMYFRKTPMKYEILSLVTPYGNGLSLGNEGKTFTFDVTDFSPILKGNRRISIERGGQWQEELDIRFLFIEGTPPREVIDVQNIWPFQSAGYRAVQQDEAFEPRMVQTNADAKYFKVRSSVTGHGQNGEFTPRDHYIDVDDNGIQEYIFRVWSECSTIPIYPQGGTWLLDRAGWCPGDPSLLTENDVTDFVTPGQAVRFDYGVIGPHMDQANYLVSNQLVSYGDFNFQMDAAVESVVRPSQKVEWERENPSCNTPTIVLKNYGEEILNACDIEYGVKGGVKETFTWTGRLHFGDSEMVELPITKPDFWREAVDNGVNVFEVRIMNINGMPDENPWNNVMKSEFELPKVFSGELALEYQTNMRGPESSYRIYNQEGTVVMQNSGLNSSTKYIDDFDLSPGCYTLEFRDTGDDGLYFWFWEQAGQPRGRGSLRISRKIGSNYLPIKTFEPEFGRFIHYDFGIEGLVSTADPALLRHLSVYPNPSNGYFTISLFSEKRRNLDFQVVSLEGRVITAGRLKLNEGDKIERLIDISGAPEGMYHLRLIEDDRVASKPIIVVK